MKKLFIVLVTIAFATPAIGGTWCEWSGTEGVNCKSDGTRGYFQLPNGINVGEKDYNEYGFYELTDTQPTIGTDQVRDEVQWSFADNAIGRTWTVRTLSATEIDERTASAMSVNDFWQWKGIQAAGGWTNTQMLTILPVELVDAYVARKALEAQ